MGSFFDCKPEENFNKLEITEEIRHDNENDNNNSTKISKSNIDTNDIKKENSKSELNKKERNEINKKKSNNIKIKKEKGKKDDDIIINNTDEEFSDKKNIKDKVKSIKKKKNKKEVINSVNFDNNKKKINNTIFINNSNATISNRNNNSNNNSHLKNSSNKGNKLKLKESEIKKEFNCFNSNEDNIELEELINKVFNNNTKNNTNNKNNETESDIDYQCNKEYFDQLYSEQSQSNINYKTDNKDIEKIINKLKEIKEKISNKNKPKKKKNKFKAKTEDYTFKPKSLSRTMNNKQIKKNIPAYRRTTPHNNYNFIFNSYTFDRNKDFQKYNNKSNNFGCFSLENSINNNLCFSMLGKSVKEPFYNNYNNNNISFQQKNLAKRNSRETQSRFSLQQSYLSNSSMFNITSSGINNNNKVCFTYIQNI